MRPTAAELAVQLGLQPHPEGGFFLETYRATETLRTPRGERAAATAILFLVTAESPSRLHRLASDELWVFQGGLPLELTIISGAGDLTVRLLGDPDEIATHPGRVSAPGEGDVGSRSAADVGAWSVQAVVPADSWQGARLAGGPHLPAERAWSLVCCVVTPGFDYTDFELGERDELLARFPRHEAVIQALS